jgi:hypothetical protein
VTVTIAFVTNAQPFFFTERYYELLDQRPEYYHLLSDFFRRQDAPKLAWIHHVNMEQLDKAGEALVKAAMTETRLQGQQVSLSFCNPSCVGLPSVK